MTGEFAFTPQLLVEILKSSVELSEPATGVGTDTRLLREGELFVALRGERFDGHDFLPQAKEMGAVAAVVEEGTGETRGLPQVQVPDTSIALGELARARRQAMPGPVIAVTGSNGKTSTREMLKAILVERFHVHATRKNENNLVGVPLTILAAPADAECLIVEVGASERGEVDRLGRVIEPDIAVITNVFEAHLSGFGTLADVLIEKVSLVEHARKAVVGLSPPQLAVLAAARCGEVLTAALDAHADFHPLRWSIDGNGHAELEWDDVSLTVPALGAHQGENACLALAVGRELGIDLEVAAPGLESTDLPPARGDAIMRSGIRIIDDTYNANPASVTALLRTVEALPREGRLILVLGTMLELGDRSAELHAAVAREAIAANPDVLVGVGEFKQTLEPFHGSWGGSLILGDSVEDVGAALRADLHPGDTIVLKASRGVRLERILPYLDSDREEPCSTTT